jgi:hypothetical protein
MTTVSKVDQNTDKALVAQTTQKTTNPLVKLPNSILLAISYYLSDLEKLRLHASDRFLRRVITPSLSQHMDGQLGGILDFSRLKSSYEKRAGVKEFSRRGQHSNREQLKALAEQQLLDRTFKAAFHLRELNLTGVKVPPRFPEGPSKPLYPRLHKLTLHSAQDAAVMERVAYHCPELQELCFLFFYGEEGGISGKFPNLTRIYITERFMPAVGLCDALLQSCPALSAVDVTTCHHRAFKQEFSTALSDFCRLPSLTSLTLNGREGLHRNLILTSDALKKIGQAKGLQKVSIFNCPHLTEEVLTELVHLPKLRDLMFAPSREQVAPIDFTKLIFPRRLDALKVNYYHGMSLSQESIEALLSSCREQNLTIVSDEVSYLDRIADCHLENPVCKNLILQFWPFMGKASDFTVDQWCQFKKKK